MKPGLSCGILGMKELDVVVHVEQHVAYRLNDGVPSASEMA